MVSKSQLMVSIDEVREVVFDAQLLKAGKPSESFHRVVKFEFVIKVADDHGGVGKQPIVE
jgi:hypothetical protein